MTLTPVLYRGVGGGVGRGGGGVSFFLLFTNRHSFINSANFNMIFFMNLPWGIVMPIHSVKCTKLITL